MDMMDFFFRNVFRSLWVGVIGLKWLIKGIAWMVSAVLNRREVNGPK